MQLSQTVEYALRAVVWLAEHPDTPQTTQQIAEATKMPPSYLSKVLQALSRAGIVTSQRGLHGGFQLHRPMNELPLLDVINAVEPIQRITTCPLGIESHGTDLCALHKALDAAIAVVEARFADTTIGDLLAKPTKSTPLCPVTIDADTPGRKAGRGADPRPPRRGAPTRAKEDRPR